MEIAKANLPVAALIWLMTIPMLVKIEVDVLAEVPVRLGVVRIVDAPRRR